jgi:hypothetical protein
MHFTCSAMAFIARRALWVLRRAAVAWLVAIAVKPPCAASLIEDTR